VDLISICTMKAVLAVVVFALVGAALAKVNPNPLSQLNITAPEDYSFGALTLTRDGFVLAALDYTGFGIAPVNSTLYSFDVRGAVPKVVNSVSLPNPGPTSLFVTNGGAQVYAVVQNVEPQTPVIVDVSVSPVGIIAANRRLQFPDELSNKILIFGVTNTLTEHLYLVERNIWTLDRTAWKLNKGAALDFPTNSNFFSGDVNAQDRTISMSGYQMCLLTDNKHAPCPNMGTWYLYRFNGTTGKIISTTHITSTEFALLTNIDTNNGLRIQDIQGTKNSINVLPFDFAQFKAGAAQPDATSRFFTFSQRVPLVRLKSCLVYALADASSMDDDKTRITQVALTEGPTAVPKVLDQQTLNVPALPVFAAPWISASATRLYVVAKTTLYVFEASC